MKVQINKDDLVDVLEKMYIVSTKSLIPNFEKVGRVTIEVKKSGRAVFTSSNGCLMAQQEADAQSGFEQGKCTTDSIRLRNAVKKIATKSPSDPIEFSVSDDTLVIRDAGSKRRKMVKLPVEMGEKPHHDTEIVKRPDGDSLFMKSDDFGRGFRAVIPFQSKATYPPKYQTVYMHWKGNETRMICGDGALFAIMSFPRHSKDSHKREFKRAIITSQLTVIANLFGISIEDADIDTNAPQDIEMIWKDKTTLWLKSGKLEVLARGLPEIDYINYESNAYRLSEARALVDIKQSDLKEVTDMLTALQDKQRAEQGKTHSCFVTVPSSPGHIRFDIKKAQGKFQCEYEIPAEYYDLGDQPSFKCCYAHLFFSSPCQTMRHEYLRLYLLDEVGAGVVNGRDANLGDKDRDGIPVVKDEEDGNGTFQFFFARLPDDEEGDGEEN